MRRLWKTNPLLGGLKAVTHRWALFTLAATLLVGAGTVLAVHDVQVFELDGDPYHGQSASTIPPPVGFSHDWDQVCKEGTASATTPLCTGVAGTSGAERVLFITDASGGSGAVDDQPATGGTHHVNDLNLWDCKVAGISPVKNDITHAFAATYDVGGDTYLYFGLDRIDAGTGDAAVGFWFYKGTHSCTPPTPDGTGHFTGQHAIGDLLVVSEFTNGGGVSTIKVYKWVGDKNGNSNSTTPPAPGGGDGALQLLASGADCRDSAGFYVPGGDAACATVNKVGTDATNKDPGTLEGNITPPWPYTNNDGGDTYKLGAFFEGGVNATELGLNLGCGGTFLADTQASQSLTSQIHDFAVGSLNLCDLQVTKTGDTISKVGDDVNYTITIENTGAVIVYKQSIVDSLIGDLTDGTNPAIVTSTCGDSLAPGASCTITLELTVAAGDPDPLVNTVTVTYDSQADTLGDEITKSDDHSVNLFQPSLTVKKTGDTLSKVGDDVNYTIEVCNTSSADTPDLVKDSVTDPLIADADGAFGVSLAAGACESHDFTRTVQAGDPDPLVNTATAHYHPDGFPNDVTASDGHSVDLFQASVTIDKTGDTLSKVGDDVNYTITVNNTSSADTPNLSCTVTDAKLGISKNVTLASGASDVTNTTYKVLAGDPDPLVNTASVSCSPAGYSNVLTASDDHSVNLFQPSVAIDKSGDALSKIGDDVHYTITVDNTSSADTPDLSCTVTDAKLAINKAVTLASGASDLTNATYTVLAGDPDPILNTASVSCSPAGFPNVLTASDSHSVNLFTPSVTLDKTGDPLSKVGDDVSYTITVNNTSTPDTPDLSCTLTDAKLGINKPFTVASGASNVTNATYAVQAGDSDPLLNTASVTCSPAGFPNVVTASDGHSVNLFQPSLTVDKTGDTLSKVGDAVSYTIKVCNTSSADTPALAKDSVSDSLIAGVNAAFAASLASGECESHDFSRTVLAGDPDPLVNTATAHYHPTGFPNDITGSDTHSVNLSQPSVKVTKSGPAFSKAGDTAIYNVTIENTSSADSPSLVLDSFADSKVAGVVPPAGCSPLAPAASCSFSYSYVVQANDAEPFVNTATAHYHPDGFPNDITASSSWTTDLLHPSFSVTKACKAEPVPQAGPAVFTITFNNTGDAGLHVVPSEGAAFDVVAGGSFSYDYSVNGPFSADVPNTVTGTVTLAAAYGLPNSYAFSASDSCTVFGEAEVVKTVSGQPPAAGQTFTFELRQGASTGAAGTILETATTDASGNISFSTPLVPGQTYQICEWVFPGWSTNLTGDGPLFVPNSIIPPSLPNPNVNNLTVCTNFTVGSGQTRTFNVDNSPPPGGRALTIGFWKNWASCASSRGRGQDPILDLALGIASATTTNPPGGLVVSAQNAGSGWPNYAALWYLVLKGNPASTEDDILNAPDCLNAVNLLDKRTIDLGKKKASDPLFNMTAQLVGAQLNRFMGAGINGATITNIDQAVLLNGKYAFNGITHGALTPADATLANCLATQLDNYNNNNAVSSCP